MKQICKKSFTRRGRIPNVCKTLPTNWLQLEKELSFIKENATLVIEYQKDKRDLIDRIPGWQREHDEQKRLLQQERETLRAETSSLQEKIDLLNKELGRSGRKCKGTAKEPGGLQQDSGIRLVQAASGYIPF